MPGCAPGATLFDMVRIPETLTPRESEVLVLLALGHTNPEVAGRLGISVRTAEAHRASITRKLGARSRAELVHHARLRGLVSVSRRAPDDAATS